MTSLCCRIAAFAAMSPQQTGGLLTCHKSSRNRAKWAAHNRFDRCNRCIQPVLAQPLDSAGDQQNGFGTDSVDSLCLGI